MKIVMGVFLFFFLVPQSIGASDQNVEKELLGILNELLDSVAAGRKEVWEKYLADSFLFNDENSGN